jgi:ferredoxin-NADP reductase
MTGGSGITSVFGLINHVLETRSEILHISLVNYNRTPDYILLQDPLELGALN